jgi:multiple sugar transport system ATP-binding protein
MRPETFEDAAFASPGLPTLDVHVSVLEELGSDAYVFFQAETQNVNVASLAAGVEQETALSDASALLSARVDPRTAARVGERMRLAVDPARFHFFDRETGASLLATAPSRAEPVSATT